MPQSALSFKGIMLRNAGIRCNKFNKKKQKTCKINELVTIINELVFNFFDEFSKLLHVFASIMHVFLFFSLFIAQNSLQNNLI